MASGLWVGDMAQFYYTRSDIASIRVNDGDKTEVVNLARQLHEMGFRLVATRGTLKRIESAGLAKDEGRDAGLILLLHSRPKFLN